MGIPKLTLTEQAFAREKGCIRRDSRWALILLGLDASSEWPTKCTSFRQNLMKATEASPLAWAFLYAAGGCVISVQERRPSAFRFSARFENPLRPFA